MDVLKERIVRDGFDRGERSQVVDQRCAGHNAADDEICRVQFWRGGRGDGKACGGRPSAWLTMPANGALLMHVPRTGRWRLRSLPRQSAQIPDNTRSKSGWRVARGAPVPLATTPITSCTVISLP